MSDNARLTHQRRSWSKLQQQGLLVPNATADQTRFWQTTDEGERQGDDTPWFIQLFLGISGLLSGLLLIGFLVLSLTEALYSHITQSIVGIILMGISYVFFRTAASEERSNAFVLSLAYAISVAGQLFLGRAIFSADIAEPLSIVIFMLVQAVLFVFIPDFLHRLSTSLIGLGCLAWLLTYYNALEVVPGLLALLTTVFSLQRYELLQYLSINKRRPALQITRTLAYASAITLLLVSVYSITGEHGYLYFIFGYNTSLNYYYPLAQGLLVLVALYAAYLILRRHNTPLLSTSNYAGIVIGTAIVLLGVLSVFVSGLLATSLVIVIAIANRQRVLLSLGVIALVGYIFWYYYQLDTTLLIKSLSMLALGIALLLLRWGIVKNYAVAPSRHSKNTKLDTARSASASSLNDAHKESEE